MESLEPEYRACQGAMRGEALPDDLDGGRLRASVVRGIRCHPTFASSEAVIKLCETDAQFRRARNARLIMSDFIPDPADMEDPEHQPYCIWHPDIASENTYRKLAAAYPSMRYQVGRACAVAGLSKLYGELKLLPDVCIAEEARESNTEGGRAIFEMIMAAPIRYAVMDDYSLSVNTENPQSPAYLNGDTDVRWRLEERRALHSVATSETEWKVSPCIEEDRRIGLDWVDGQKKHQHLTVEESRLLYQPLPLDLPTVKKNLLICMAAHDGNIDRYARLCRPTIMVEGELECITRGIYHHTMFARWWAEEIAQNTPRIQRLRSDPGFYDILSAISARRIMINDTQEFEGSWPPGHADSRQGWLAGAPQPFNIWYPLKPCSTTLHTLATTVPSMRLQAAVACVLLDYENVYKIIDPEPDLHLVLAAEQSPNRFYYQDLKEKLSKGGDSIENVHFTTYERDAYCLDKDLDPTFSPSFGAYLPDGIEGRRDYYAQYGPYSGMAPKTGDVEQYVWATPEFLWQLALDEEETEEDGGDDEAEPGESPPTSAHPTPFSSIFVY